ncbi:peptide ABC transporter ATP-binding protein [Vulcanibacillus modesticaldus]|uniref:Peptide ABC transporter ATP-binding protein n=1 Tax=Vulcanibacillus modesticaldus TaxID=337097 RepID=A0A1D2YVJ2_9BACI|nr:ABC transporter ATP-binding protein [Vulcanibacillus modesticaldus]OEF99740.1 peptide ABC transporter ATP-binding protein [Vulcanibacillus modesticaldus]
MQTEPLLIIRDLKTYFYTDGKEVKAVDGVNFQIYKGETVALVGESGSGKSVTSMSILRLIPDPPGKIVNGEIIFNKLDLLKLSESDINEIRGNEISMIFQEPMTSLNPVFTIGEQIMEGLRHHHNLDKANARKKAIRLLQLVGFPRAEDIIDEYPHQLSGGMRQRAMIAMAMSLEPKLLIADEPTTALDVTIQAQILELMRDVKEKFNTSILLITHDLGVVAEMADRVLVMYGGQIVEEGDVYTIFESPNHPYTKGLLSSIPSLNDDKDRLESIEGTVPAAHEFPKGCRFAPRCGEKKLSICEEKLPQLQEIGNGHKVRCFLYERVEA